MRHQPARALISLQTSLCFPPLKSAGTKYNLEVRTKFGGDAVGGGGGGEERKRKGIEASLL